MQIKIKVQSINDNNLLLDKLISNSSDTNAFKIVKQEGYRSVDSVVAVITALGSLGLSGILVALINSIKDVQIAKINSQDNLGKSKDNLEIEKLKVELEAKNNESKDNIELEKIKLDKAKLKKEIDEIKLKGHLEIVGNYVDTILTNESNNKRKQLEDLGIQFDDNEVIVPISEKLNTETLKMLDEVLEVKAITEISHIEKT